jgi:hypothetical protein
MNFIGKVKYCIRDEPEGDYLIGAQVIETNDQIGSWGILESP